MSPTLRARILMLMEQSESTTSAYLGDTEIASALNVTVLEVQHQLEILEDDGLVEVCKTFGPTYDVLLTPGGRKTLEAAAQDAQDDEAPARQRIGF